MSLNIHKACATRLIEKLAELLPNITINNRIFLDIKSTIPLLSAESVLPERGEIKDSLVEYISESPLYDFVYESLSKELYESEKYDTNCPVLRLVDIDKYRDPVTTATRLVQSFDSLPWRYTLTIKMADELSKSVGLLIGNFSISNSLRVIVPNKEFDKSFPLQSGIEARDRSLNGGWSLLPTFVPPKWKEGAAYIQIEIDGFIGQLGETATLERAISILKTFCGLGIALRLLKVDRRYRPTPIRAKFFIHQKINDSWEIARTHQLKDSISDAFNDLYFFDLEGELDTEAKRTSRANSIMGLIKTVFSTPERAEKIMLAAQWLFDSYSGQNELLSFVQTTIVLEILLGEKASSDITGLGELLRNRCAYLIGKSQQQRDEILEDFKEIYDVRSEIVHRGKSRLSDRERSLLTKLQWMCRRVIQKEVDLLKEDLKIMHSNG